MPMMELIENTHGEEAITPDRCSIGICASDGAPKLLDLLNVIRSEEFPKYLGLNKIVIVASGCEPQVLSLLRQLAEKDPRINLLEEPERNGKAEALNKIIQQCEGDHILFVNSDALPQSGSISKLFRALKNDPSVGIVSACPVLDAGAKEGTTFGVEELMWSVHNEASLLLNHMKISNHSSDEMMLVRSSALETLPKNLVNDGAYLAGRAKLKGYLIKFCEDAKVGIDVPSRLSDLISQRRRIIYGHMQVKRLTGSSPKTVKFLLLSNPMLSLSIAFKTLLKRPSRLRALPLALMCEGISSLLALYDTSLDSPNKHSVWKRYGN